LNAKSNENNGDHLLKLGFITAHNKTKDDKDQHLYRPLFI